MSSRSAFRTVAIRLREHWSNPITIAIVGGLIAVLAYAWEREETLAALSVGLIVSGAAFAVGSVIGFLFGIPRAVQEARNPTVAMARFEAQYQVNTNLEQISDWLTKIIVGVTLVQIGKIAPAFMALAEYVALAFGSPPVPPSFAAVILVYFGVSGFLAFYLWTRVILTTEFTRADRAARNSPEFYEGLIEALLYQPPPEGFQTALEVGQEFLQRFGEGNWRVWRAMACVYGQEFQFLQAAENPNQAELGAARNHALAAVKRVLTLNPDELESKRTLFKKDATPQENDLVVFADDEEFKKVLGVP